MMLSLPFLVLTVLSSIYLTVNAQGYKRVCYYTNWAQYRPGVGKYFPENVDPFLCTHIIYAFAKLEGNKLKAFEWNDESTPWMRGMFARFQDLKKKNRNLKTLLALGGWNMGSKPFTALVKTAKLRSEFAADSVTFLRKRGFDGIDMDWEYPANRGSPPEDREKFQMLVTEMRRVFNEEARNTGKEPLLLTSAVAAGRSKIDTGYDIPALCRDLDFINLMTYDLHGSWEDFTGHNSPLFAHSTETGDQRYLNMDWASNYWVQMGCPKHKINIGMGMYGRSFTLRDPYNNALMAPTRGKGKAGKFTREGGFLSYYEICKMLQAGAQFHYIQDQEVPYLVSGDQWVGYDDVDSLKLKVQWMRQKGFGGVMIWALDLDDFNNQCGQGKYPLLTTINRELGVPISQTPVQPRKQPPRHSQHQFPQPRRTPTQQRPNPPQTRHSPGRLPHLPQQPRRHHPPRPTTTTLAPVQHNAPSLTQEFNCNGASTGYFRSDISCTDYFICAGGTAFKFHCANGLMWNSEMNFCDWPEKVSCHLNNNQMHAPAFVPPPAQPPATPAPTPPPTPPPTLPPTPPPTPAPRRPDPTPPRRVAPQPTMQSVTPSWMDWHRWAVEFLKAIMASPSMWSAQPQQQQQQPQQQQQQQQSFHPQANLPQPPSAFPISPPSDFPQPPGSFDTIPQNFPEPVQQADTIPQHFPQQAQPAQRQNTFASQQQSKFVQPQQQSNFVQPQQHSNFVQPQQQSNFVQPHQQDNFSPPQQQSQFTPPQEQNHFHQPQQQHNFVSQVEPFQQPQQQIPPQPPKAPKTFCTGKSDSIHPDPNDCTKYINCANGHLYEAKCPPGTAFQETLQTCDYEKNVVSCTNHKRTIKG